MGSLFHSGHYAAVAHRVSRERKRLKNKKVIYVLASGEGQSTSRRVGTGFRNKTCVKTKKRAAENGALQILHFADAF